MSDTEEDKAVKFRDKSVEILLKEYDTLRDEMKLYLTFLRQDTRMILLALGAVIAFSKVAGNDVSVLFPIIPSVVFVFILSQFMSLHMISTEAYACGKIEKKVNKLMGFKVMRWESKVAKLKVRGLLSVTTLSTFFIIIATFILFIYALTLEQIIHPHSLNILHIVEGLILIALFIRLCYLEWKNLK